MKPLYCLIVGLLTVFAANSQHCKALEKASFFKSMKFGDKVPAGLFTNCQKTKPGYGGGLYRIAYDSLSQNCRKEYAELFNFLFVPFSFLQLITNQKGEISSIELYSFFDDRRDESIIYKLPGNFTGLYDQLVSHYGKPTHVQQATGTDSLFIRDLGMPRVADWECDNISLRLRVVYGARNKDLNILHIQVRNRGFEASPEEEVSQ